MHVQIRILIQHDSPTLRHRLCLQATNHPSQSMHEQIRLFSVLPIELEVASIFMFGVNFVLSEPFISSSLA